MVRCVVLLVLTLLAGCSYSSPDPNPEKVLNSAAFEAQDANVITMTAGEAMDQLRSYRMQGQVKRDGVPVTFDLQVKRTGCAGRVGTLNETYEVSMHKFNGVYYRSGTDWTYQATDSRNWWAMCEVGLVASNLQNQSTTTGATPDRSVVGVGEGRVVRLSYGSAGFADVELTRPHRVIQLVSPGVEIHFSNFDEDFKIPRPSRAKASDVDVNLFARDATLLR